MTKFEKNMAPAARRAHEIAMAQQSIDGGIAALVKNGLDMELAEHLGNKTGKVVAQALGENGQDFDR